MDENSLRNTYTFKIKLGIDDLMGVTNEYGEFVGCSLIKDFDKYIANHEYYDNLIKQKNEEYIKLLLERNEYGKEVECDLSLIHNPLFDGPSEPKPIEEFHPSESYRMVFLDLTETPEEDKKLQQEAKYKLENTDISFYEYPDERTGKTFRGNNIPHLIDLIVAANNEDQYVRWALENWTKEDWQKYRVTKYLICGSPGEMTPEVQNKILQTFKQNNMTTEEQIKAVKQLRVDIDKNIQDVKEFQDVKKEKGHREIALVITKLQEAKMWLGQVLAEIGATTPYPHADNPANSIVSPTADVFEKEVDPNLRGFISTSQQETFLSPKDLIEDEEDYSTQHVEYKKEVVEEVITENQIVEESEQKVMLLSNITNRINNPKVSYPVVSIHFILKGQTIESLKTLLVKLTTTWEGAFDFKENPILHCFLPYDQVIEKGYSTELYEELLLPYFNTLVCLYEYGENIQEVREIMFKTLAESKGSAIFIGNVIEGVQEEWDMAKKAGVQILHLPHIAESK